MNDTVYKDIITFIPPSIGHFKMIRNWLTGIYGYSLISHGDLATIHFIERDKEELEKRVKFTRIALKSIDIKVIC